MTIKPLIILPDPVLRQVSRPLETVDSRVLKLADDMLDTMYDAPGIGLAAIQVGEPLRMLVIDVAKEEDDGKPQQLAAEGLLATCLQHEIDHLDGVLFIDHISRLKRDMVVKKFTKASKTGALPKF